MSSLPDPGFADDDGAATPALTEALRAYDRNPDGLHDATLAVLAQQRLLVPVVAVLGEMETGGPDGERLPREKSSDMATVLMRGRDGRTALLAFTSIQTLQRWNPEARPVPVLAAAAAEAALADHASAVVVDVAGPVMFVVEGDDLRALAAGEVLMRLGDQVSDRYGWVRPDP
ncbi:MAG: SseB family protein [Nocardioidaceae bacterium]